MRSYVYTPSENVDKNVNGSLQMLLVTVSKMHTGTVIKSRVTFAVHCSVYSPCVKSSVIIVLIIAPSTMKWSPSVRTLDAATHALVKYHQATLLSRSRVLVVVSNL